MSRFVTSSKAVNQLPELKRRDRAGRQLARMRGGLPAPVARDLRKPGMLRGLEIPDSFFLDPLPDDELALWY